MGRIIFILGGARSGKSTYALKLAKKYKNVTFIATCQAFDKEMAHRIRLHKESRPDHWQTIEEHKNISSALNKLNPKTEYVIIDCLTLYVSNLMLSGKNQETIIDNINQALSLLKKNRIHAIIVSNEVGLGIVPTNKLARNFRDIAGRVNQKVASEADQVLFMVSGIPMPVKDKSLREKR